MKKIVALVLTTILCISLCSCEMLEKYFPSNSKEPEEVKDTTVTEEEWNAALAIVNYTLNGENNSVTKQVTSNPELGTVESIDNSTMLCEQDETAQHTKEKYTTKGTFGDKTEENSYDTERYIVYNAADDAWYHLSEIEDTGEWVGSPYGYYDAQDLNRRLYIDSVENTIDNFTYDEDKKAYVRDIQMSLGASQVEITSAKLYFYFEDNNLVKAVVIVEAEGSGTTDYNGEAVSYTITITKTNTLLISNHGTTTVTVPEYTVR